MGVASSSRTFFQQIGGSIGVSIFGVIFARRLTQEMAARVPGVHLHSSGGQFDPATVDRLPATIRHDVFFAIPHAVQGIFVWAAPVAVAVFLLALFVREVPLRGRAPADEQPTAELVG